MTKKQILKITAFIALFIWLLISVTYVLRMNGDVKDRFTGFYALKKDSVDTVIIGSSPVYPCYSAPKIWGETGNPTYLISTNMQRPISDVYLVKEIEKTQSPKLYVFEMRMYTAREEDLTSNMAHTREVTDNLKYSLNRVQAINAMVDDPSERLSYYFDIFKYHSNWKTLFLWSQLRDFTYSYPDDMEGYVFANEVGPTTAPDVSDVTEATPIDDTQDKCLTELLEYLKANNLNALFIVTPYEIDEEKKANYNYIEGVVNGYGYNFLDMNDYYSEIGIDFGTDYGDYGNHTNALGSEKVTAFFEKYLQDNYDFEDKRGNESYKAFDDSYQLYLAELENQKKIINDKIENKEWNDLESED